MSDADRGPDVSNREIVAVFERMDERRLRPKEVADELPISLDRLSDRLDDLHEQGVLVRDDEGLPTARWRLGPQADDVSISDESVETDTEAQASKVAGTESPPRAEETPETPPPDPGTDDPYGTDVPAAYEIDAFEPPGTPEERDLRREALRRAYAYLRQRDEARRQEFESDVFPEVSAGYESADDGWWEQVIRPGLGSLSDVTSSDEGNRWRFTGDGHADGPTDESDMSR